MAEVWLAEHKRNGRKAAIKILKAAATADPNFEKLFLREGQVLASFDHPNIARIYDNDHVGGSAFLVMEYLTGGTLFERMQRAPITIGEALGLVAQIASGLDAAHRQGVIHRDLKPANIMLRDETTPVLTDFGASRLLDRSTIYGHEGMIVGTPIYMSPEQVTGQTLSGSSDLYALGVIFHELLTGDRPFPGVSFPEIASQHLYAPIPKLPAAIAMLQPVLERLLAKSAQERYPSAHALVDALRAIFIHDEALRLQVGYAGTSLAWSSQLRALGFVLDTEQKVDIRRAQGEFMGATPIPPPVVLAPPAGATPAGPSPRPDRPTEPLKRPTSHQQAVAAAAQRPTESARPASPTRTALMVATLIVALVAIATGVWWWQGRTQRPGPPEAPRVAEARVPKVDPSFAPAEQGGAATTIDDDLPTDDDAATEPPSDEQQALADAIAAISALEAKNRFTVEGGGSVSDRRLNVFWLAADSGEDIDWQDARQHCWDRGAGWSLPSLAQLDELFDRTGTLTASCGDATCQLTPMIALSSAKQWTGEGTGSGNQAWHIDMSSGKRVETAVVNPYGLRALCVRSGSSGGSKE